MPAPLDYYEILQVSPNAEAEIIQVAYQRLASKWHPDKNPGDQLAYERMILVNEAYEVLSDPVKRQEYNLSRSQPSASQGEGVPAQSGREKKPASSPAESTARSGPELCWFCQRNDANGKSASVDLYYVISSNLIRTDVTYKTVRIEIPRCSVCENQHKQRLVLIWGPVVLGVGLVVTGLLAASKRLDGPEWPFVAFVAGLVLVIGGCFWGVVGRAVWLRRTFATFPQVRALLKTGWTFHI